MKFCKVELHDNFMIVIVDEGETIDILKARELKDLATSTFHDRPFIYITHRIHSYAVDPKVYKPTSQIMNLVGFCVVSSNFMAKSNAIIEKLFFDKPFEVFDTLIEAIDWSNTAIKNYQK